MQGLAIDRDSLTLAAMLTLMIVPPLAALSHLMSSFAKDNKQIPLPSVPSEEAISLAYERISQIGQYEQSSMTAILSEKSGRPVWNIMHKNEIHKDAICVIDGWTGEIMMMNAS